MGYRRAKEPEICKRLAARRLNITQPHGRGAHSETGEDTINLDTGRIKSRIYSPDTGRDGPVLSRCCPVCRCRTVWVGSSVMATSRSIFSLGIGVDRPILDSRTLTRTRIRAEAEYARKSTWLRLESRQNRAPSSLPSPLVRIARPLSCVRARVSPSRYLEKPLPLITLLPPPIPPTSPRVPPETLFDTI